MFPFQEQGQCVCLPGYGGLSCGVPITSDSATYQPVHDPWRQNGIGAFFSFRAVMGHSVVSCDDENIYMFGGYAFNGREHKKSLLWKYNVYSNDWDLITPLSSEQPTNR